MWRISRIIKSYAKMAESSGFKAVILDIDGTLLDSNDAHARAFEQAFKEIVSFHMKTFGV